MKNNYKILAEFAKDISYETPDIETFLYAKDNILKYNLNIDITSKPIKNKIVEVDVLLKFEEPNLEKKRAQFEITYAAIVRIEQNVKDKKEAEKIILIHVPTEIYPKLENLLLSLINKSGYPNFKINKKVDFEKLYKAKFNQ